MHRTDPTRIAFLQNQMIDKIREKGYFLPKQRIAVINALCTMEKVSDPVDLWIHLRQRHIKISIGAVYCNLKLMVKEQLVLKTYNVGKSFSYELIQES